MNKWTESQVGELMAQMTLVFRWLRTKINEWELEWLLASPTNKVASAWMWKYSTH